MRPLNPRRSLLPASLLALVAQLLLTATAVASTTGGGFPMLQK